MIPFALTMGVNFSNVPVAYAYSLIVAGLLMSYYYIAGMGQISLTGTIIATYPLITVVLSFLFLQENPSMPQKVAILLTIAGAIFIAMPAKLTQMRAHIGSWFWWAVSCAVASGVADLFSKVAINESDMSTYLFAYPFASATVVVISFFFDKKGRKIPKITKKLYLPTVLGVGMMELGLFFFYLAIGAGLVSLVSPISSIYVAITAILARIFLKEKITKLQTVGIIFSVAGIILVGIS
jgi:uncharacterized membrane protein